MNSDDFKEPSLNPKPERRTEMARRKTDKKAIVLRRNANLSPGPCGLCGADCFSDGLDFFLKDTPKLVCEKCVVREVPDLAQTHDDAHDWRDKGQNEAFDAGKQAGIRELRNKVASFLAKDPTDRLLAYCDALQGENDDLPF